MHSFTACVLISTSCSYSSRQPCPLPLPTSNPFRPISSKQQTVNSRIRWGTSRLSASSRYFCHRLTYVLSRTEWVMFKHTCFICKCPPLHLFKSKDCIISNTLIGMNKCLLNKWHLVRKSLLNGNHLCYCISVPTFLRLQSISSSPHSPTSTYSLTQLWELWRLPQLHGKLQRWGGGTWEHLLYGLLYWSLQLKGFIFREGVICMVNLKPCYLKG